MPRLPFLTFPQKLKFRNTTGIVCYYCCTVCRRSVSNQLSGRCTTGYFQYLCYIVLLCSSRANRPTPLPVAYCSSSLLSRVRLLPNLIAVSSPTGCCPPPKSLDSPAVSGALSSSLSWPHQIILFGVSLYTTSVLQYTFTLWAPCHHPAVSLRQFRPHS